MARMSVMTPAQKLHLLIQSRGWDKKQLLSVVPFVSATTVYNWLKGEGAPSLKAALAIAREFDVPIEWLADDEMDYPPQADEFSGAVRQATKIVRALRLDEDEVIRRLSSCNAGPPGREEAGRVRWVAVRDETEAALRRERERSRPKRAAKPKPASDVEIDGDHEQGKAKGKPTGV